MRILQLSDPHLVAADRARVRGRPALPLLERALDNAAEQHPDLLLITGDLCQDESWGGYVRLWRALEQRIQCPVALVPGNHDHPLLLQSVLGRRCSTAPADLMVQGVRLLLLNSHWSGCSAGQLGSRQLAWLAERLGTRERRDLPFIVALHHPPVRVGHSVLDSMNLKDAAALMALLRPMQSLRAIVFGHIHQHWQGHCPGIPEVPLLGCPSTLRSFDAVQPCPLGRADDPGARVLDFAPGGGMRHRLLRWSAC